MRRKQFIVGKPDATMGFSAVALLGVLCGIPGGDSMAALYRYDFAGQLTQVPDGTTIQVGDAFHGSWTVETEQLGNAFASGNGRSYELRNLTLSLGGESLNVDDVPGLLIAENEVDPPHPQIWPSGFSSDYVATSNNAGEIPLWGTTVTRYQVLFSYDGLGVWDEFRIPGPFDFLENLADGGLAIDTLGTGPGSGVNIFGRIDTIVPTPVPLPASALLFGIPLVWLFRSRSSVYGYRIQSNTPLNQENNLRRYNAFSRRAITFTSRKRIAGTAKRAVLAAFARH